MSWPECKLKDLGEIVTGSTPSISNENYFGGKIPFVTPSELDLNQPIMSTPRTLTQAGADVSRVIPEGSVMVCCIGSLGKIGLAGTSMVTNQQINSIIFDSKKVDKKYGFYACKRLKSKLLSIAPATTVPIVNKTRFSELAIPLPPLAEQQRIAEILDKAELVKRKRELAIEKLNDLAQSLFVEMFGDFSKKSQLHKLEEFNNLINETKLGLVRGTSELNDFNGYPYLRMNAITSNGELQFNKLMFTNASDIEVKEYTLKKHDFLFNTRNSKELVGKTAIFLNEDNNYLFNNNIMRIRFNQNANPSYIAHAFKTQYVQNQLENIKSGTTNVFAIYFKDLKNIKIPIPNIVDQNTFALKIEALHLLKNKFKESVNAMKVFNASLQNQAFKVGFDA